MTRYEDTFNRAIMAYEQESPEAAVRILEEAIEYELNAQDPEYDSIARYSNEIARMYGEAGHWEVSEHYLLKGLGICEDAGLREEFFFVKMIGNLATVYKDAGEVELAKEVYSDCLNRLLPIEEAMGTGDPESLQEVRNLHGMTLLHYGQILNDEGHHETAMNNIYEAFNIFSAGPIEDSHRMGLALEQMATCHHSQGDLASAIDCATRADAMTRPTITEGIYRIPANKANLAIYLMEAERISEAEVKINEAIEIAHRIVDDDHPVVAEFNWILAMIYFTSGRQQEALRVANGSLAVFERELDASDPRLEQLREFIHMCKIATSEDPIGDGLIEINLPDY